jgi:hypothetical protein
MTILNYTFFSPNGTEFPVGSNNDGKLYMMLTGMDYSTLRRKDWSEPVTTALNIQYVNTSLVVGGRYFELVNETIALTANAQNYIHANIDLTQTANPVSISAETNDNSNAIDLNNDSGVLKVVIDIVGTNGQGVVGTEVPENITYLDRLVVKHASNEFGQLAASKLEEDWNITEVGGGIYRFSRIINTTQAVNNPWGSLFISSEIGIPVLPSGYNRNFVTATMSNTGNLMWCAITSANAFRLISGSNTSGATRQVLVEAFATKNP